MPIKGVSSSFNIYLVGFMGSGKTTVGRVLARRFGVPFVDLDEVIRHREGMSIEDVFSKKGEAYFRRLESEVLRGCGLGKVVSTGGGIVESRENVEFMRNTGKVVWLDISFEEFLKRVPDLGDRPLLKRGKNWLKELFEKRKTFYKEASHIRISVDGKKAEDIVEEIVCLLNLR